MYRNILVPLDGSPLAEEILPQVKELARLTRRLSENRLIGPFSRKKFEIILKDTRL